MIRNDNLSPAKWCPRWDDHDMYDIHDHCADCAIIMILIIIVTGDNDNHLMTIIWVMRQMIITSKMVSTVG